MFKEEDLEQFNSLKYRTKYINHLLNKVIGSTELTEVDKEVVRGLAGEYVSANSGRASVRCLVRVLAEVEKIVKGKGKVSGKGSGKRLKY